MSEDFRDAANNEAARAKVNRDGGDWQGKSEFDRSDRKPSTRPRIRIGRPISSTNYGKADGNVTRESRPRMREATERHTDSAYQARSYERRLSGQTGYAEGYTPRSNAAYNERGEEGQARLRTGSRDTFGSRPAAQPRAAKPANKNKGQKKYDPNAKYSTKKRLEYKEDHIDPNAPVRLNKYLANAGVCSRRDADKYIQAGVVTVNGVVVTELGTKVLRTDVVHFHDNLISMEKKVYILLNKPKGYVTTSDDPQKRKTVMDLVRNACPERIYPVGRLDRNTTGVLLLTNDGEMAAKLTHPKFMKKKVYHVFCDKNVSVADMRQILEGITLEDGDIKADAIEYASLTDKKQVGIEIHSGRNRIVRRIFEHLGYRVTKLDRVYFAGLTKKNVKRGDWRYLTEEEVIALRMGAFE